MDRSGSPGPQSGVTRGILWMVFATFFFSMIVIGARRVAHLPGIEIVFFQSIGTSICMMPWLFGAGLGALKTDRLAIHLLRGLGATAGMATMFFALRSMAAADVSALLFTAGLFTVLLATIVLRESLGVRRAVAIVIGFAGALVIIRPGFQETGWAHLAMLFVGLSFGAVNVATRFFAGTGNVNAVVLYMYGLMALMSAIPALLVWRTPAVADIPWLIGLGIVSALAQQGITRSFASAATATVMPAYYLQLPFAALLGYLAFGEVPGAWIWVGAAIICGATYYIVRVESAS